MDTEIKLDIRIIFKLMTTSERLDLESKIDTFISNQVAGSYKVNMIFDNPKNSSCPISFETKLHILVDTVNDVSNVRTAIMNALDTMPEVLKYTFKMEENRIVVHPESPPEEP